MTFVNFASVFKKIKREITIIFTEIHESTIQKAQ
jgi:hypothetical protein